MTSLIFGFIAAFFLAALPGRWLINRMKTIGAGQNVSSDAPRSHIAKQGTPTMGGILILFSITVVMMIYMSVVEQDSSRHPASQWLALPLLLICILFGVIGFIDDYLSLKRGKNLGLTAREKFAAQCTAAGAFTLWIALTAQPGITTDMELLPSRLLPYSASGQIVAHLGEWYYLFCFLLMVGLSNAVNFTDGLDGLAGGCSFVIFMALAGLTLSRTPDVALFCAAMAGALGGFLWWNGHPAKIFMGDTGSLAIGASMAAAAMLGKQEIGLLVASIVCWVELISVIIQVTVFKWRKRRIGLEYARTHRVFLKTPLHHHFEESGWPETQVTLRFWLICFLLAALSLLWGHGG